MIENNEIPSGKKRLIASKPIFITAMLLLVLITLSIWLSGIGVHRSIFKNALIAISVMSCVCFLFFSFSLFKGFKLKDDLGKITHKFKWGSSYNFPDFGFGKSSSSSGSSGGGHFHFDMEGIFEIIIAIIAGIVIVLFLLVFLWLFGNIIWAITLFFAAALYWIFFRAIRFVLRHAGNCKGNFWKSISYGFGYTVLYSFTFYFLVLIPHLLRQ